MSTMASSATNDTAERCQRLRSEIKNWEKAFAAANGRKASQDDLKKQSEIAQKSKEYYKLKARLSNQDPFTTTTTASFSSSPPSKKRKSSETHQAPSSASRRRRLSTKPVHPATLDPYDSPCSVTRTPLAQRTFVGPTPQKNGIVLGLFDLLSPPTHSTPSKKQQTLAAQLSPSTAPPPKSLDLHATPSKPRACASTATTTSTPARHARTPQSSSKRAWLETFLTPSALRFTQPHTHAHITTPASSKRGAANPSPPCPRPDETPEFLRRDGPRRPFSSVAAAAGAHDGYDADVFSWSPVAVRRIPPKPAGRGLSALVRGLREQEDAALDEDLEALKEVEALARGEEYVPVRKEKEALVMDSQAEMPLGRDGGRSSGEDEGRVAGTEEGKGGRQRKAWKKKGQKRTTRRVVMRPSVAKWVPETPWDVGAGSVSGEDGGDGGGGGGEADGDAGQKGKDNEGGDGGKEGKEPKARAAKKISATANPNFRTLNIKNKQSKGKRGGKFGRRR